MERVGASRMTDQPLFQVITELVKPQRPHTLARALRMDMGDMAGILRMVVNGGFGIKRADGVYELTQEGLDLAHETIVAAAMSTMEPERRQAELDRRRERLIQQMDNLTKEPEAAKASIVASFFADPEVERLSLTEELLDWVAENEANLAAYDPSAPVPAEDTRVTLRNGTSVLVASTYYVGGLPGEPAPAPKRARAAFRTHAELKRTGRI